MLFADFLKRMLKSAGYHVRHVMNITDVGHNTSDCDVGEDKMEKGAAREGKTVWEIAEHYTAEFLKDIRHLNIMHPDVLCKATDHIKEQLAMIALLEKQGFTYDTGEVIYFDTAKFQQYGRLSKQTWDALQEGQGRVDPDEKKKHATDFALWIRTVGKHKHHIMRWPSPYGEGYPGWHIECSAMAWKYLGEQFDIHCGGSDLIPIHHTNEIAQSDGAFGKQAVRYWMHAGFLAEQDKKMSKSAGEFLTLPVLLKKGYDPLAYRYFCTTGHYRQILNFSWEALDAAQTALDNLRQKVYDWTQAGGVVAEHDHVPMHAHRKAFLDAITDDLNLPVAMAAVWAVVKDSVLSPAARQSLVLEFDHVLGFNLEQWKPVTVEVPAVVQKLVAEREAARKAKDFKRSDTLRAEIARLGFAVDDTGNGGVVKKL